jgi:hypothetical protein
MQRTWTNQGSGCIPDASFRRLIFFPQDQIMRLLSLLIVYVALEMVQGGSFYLIGDSIAAHWQSVDTFKRNLTAKSTMLAGWGTYLPLFTDWKVKNVARGYMSTRSFLYFFDEKVGSKIHADCPFPSTSIMKGEPPRYHNECFKLEAGDVAIIALGINDLCDKNYAEKDFICSEPMNGASPKALEGEKEVLKYEQYLQTIVEKLRKLQPDISILMTTHTPLLDSNNPTSKTSPLLDRMKQFVEKSGDPKIKLVDLASISAQFIETFESPLKFLEVYHQQVQGGDGKMMRDLHANVYGAAMYAALFSCAVKKAKFEGDFLNEAGMKLDCENLANNLKHPSLRIPYDFNVDSNKKITVPKMEFRKCKKKPQ